MKFKLKETEIMIRNETVRIRELSHAERLQWVKDATKDRFRGPALLISLGSIDPKFDEKTAGELPSDVVSVLSDAILVHSNMSVKKKAKTDSEDEGGSETADDTSEENASEKQS